MPTLRQENKGIYWTWKAMKQRCLNPKCKEYKNYGARGIKVCDEWLKFEPFCYWSLENGYKRFLEIDRIDNNGNYEPSNCRWVTRKVNSNNRRKSVYLTVNGNTKTMAMWSDELGIPHVVICSWRRTYGESYAIEKIKDAIENGYEKKHLGIAHNYPVIHVESGITFDSFKAAARYFHVNKNTISNSARNNLTTKVGTFKLIEVEKKQTEKKPDYGIYVSIKKLEQTVNRKELFEETLEFEKYASSKDQLEGIENTIVMLNEVIENLKSRIKEGNK